MGGRKTCFFPGWDCFVLIFFWSLNVFLQTSMESALLLSTKPGLMDYHLLGLTLVFFFGDTKVLAGYPIWW